MSDKVKDDTDVPTNNYYDLFKGLSCSTETKRYRALVQALDTRKFEIEMYWKRATYFWTLIAASLIGYGAMSNSASAALADSEKQLIRCVISALGLLFSFAWVLVNKGSKQWQENWENHVDLLEDAVIGPLHKTVLRRPKVNGLDRFKEFVAGPAAFSVSAINQIISYFTLAIWVVLFSRTLPGFGLNFSFWLDSEWWVLFFLVVSLVLFFWAGRTHLSDHRNRARLRVSRITEITPEPMVLDPLCNETSVASPAPAAKSD